MTEQKFETMLWSIVTGIRKSRMSLPHVVAESDWTTVSPIDFQRWLLQRDRAEYDKHIAESAKKDFEAIRQWHEAQTATRDEITRRWVLAKLTDEECRVLGVSRS